MNAITQRDEPKQKSIIVTMADRFGMAPAAFEATVRATCMPVGRDAPQATPAEFAAFILVAKQYGLNPLTKEIYAYPRKGGGIVPVVSVDGWSNLINSHPEFDGVTFDVQKDGAKLVAITCNIYRKDRKHPTAITEYLEECVRETGPWRMKHRMLRHKALIQCARYAFGFAGIHDEDEAERIVEASAQEAIGGPEAPPQAVVAQVERRELPAETPTPAREAPSAPPEEIQEAEFSESVEQAPAAVEEMEAPFDFQTWIEDEVRPRYMEARTHGEVEQVFAVFEDTANDLPRAQRNTFEALYEQHVERVTRKPEPEQAETASEPGPAPEDDDGFPGDEYIAPMKEPTKGSLWERACEDLIEKSDRTAKDLGQGWTILLKQGNALAAEGEVGQDDVAGWHKRMMDEYVRLGGKPTGKTKGAAEKKAENKPAEKPADDTVGMNADEFMEHLRTRLDGLSTADAANEFWDSTLGARNRYLESEPALGGAFRAIVQKRRTQIVAQG